MLLRITATTAAALGIIYLHLTFKEDIPESLMTSLPANVTESAGKSGCLGVTVASHEISGGHLAKKRTTGNAVAMEMLQVWLHRNSQE